MAIKNHELVTFNFHDFLSTPYTLIFSSSSANVSSFVCPFCLNECTGRNVQGMDITSKRNVQRMDITFERNLQVTDITSERNVQGDGHYK